MSTAICCHLYQLNILSVSLVTMALPYCGVNLFNSRMLMTTHTICLSVPDSLHSIQCPLVPSWCSKSQNFILFMNEEYLSSLFVHGRLTSHLGFCEWCRRRPDTAHVSSYWFLSPWMWIPGVVLLDHVVLWSTFTSRFRAVAILIFPVAGLTYTHQRCVDVLCSDYYQCLLLVLNENHSNWGEMISHHVLIYISLSLVMVSIFMDPFIICPSS